MDQGQGTSSHGGKSDGREKVHPAFMSSVSDWVWQVTPDGQCTFSSERVRELLGYEKGEVLGKTRLDFMPDDELRRVGPIFQECISHGTQIVRLESTNIRKDGRKVVLETSGGPLFDESGRLEGFGGIDRDVTERKLMERCAPRERGTLSHAGGTVARTYCCKRR